MASIRERRWRRNGKTLKTMVVDYTDADGKRRLQTFKSMRAASAFKAAIEYANSVEGIVTSFRAAPLPAPTPIALPYEQGNTSLADDLLHGCETIAAYVGRPARATFHLLSQGHLPAKKMGNRWVASKSALREALARF